MTLLVGLLPRIAVFVLSAAIGAGVASVGVTALNVQGPTTAAGDQPGFVFAGADSPDGEAPAAFDTEPAEQEPQVLQALPPADLALAAEALIGAEPVAFVNPSGFPRIPPVTQWDGGPFANANCMLASGAMLARLGFGIVTTGSILRSLQDDQDGGTGLDDLATALWRGYGVALPSGMLRPDQLKALVRAGYGAAIQGLYSEIPVALRLQKSYTGAHGIYVDGYYEGDPARGIPEAYFVIDPLGRPTLGYEGEWWPASVVDDFGTTFGGGRIPAMWAFPPGGTPPDVVGPDVPPIPPSGGGGGPEPSLGPGETPAPSLEPVFPVEPGDITATIPAFDPPLGGPVAIGEIAIIPALQICLLDPKPPGCPTGIEAIFRGGDLPVVQLAPGPEVAVVFVDSDRPNVALVGFTVDPPATATVRFWEADGTPPTVGSPSAMSSIPLLGMTVMVARLDVLAATTYHFQVVAGSGLSTGVSPVGSFTTASGVARFDVALASVASPVFTLGSGLSPYLHPAPEAFARPLVPLNVLGDAACAAEAGYGGTTYCIRIADPLAPPPVECTKAIVDYELSGIEAESVLVRAFPTARGVLPGGGMTLDGVIEVEGPAPSGQASVGCLAPGMTYSIVLDAVGDDRGVLATRVVAVP